ncbi:MAG: DUF2971 domain-containing protein, partial [Desulfobacteraceae bacterium]|nr:DUF2971 domain-containing protein [Desulfobacteraceae bacterium]
MKKVSEKANNANDENKVELDALYKYGKFDKHTEKLFTHNEIYFSSPDEFNDPFDSKPRIICEGNKQQIENYLCELYGKKYPGRSKEEILADVKREIITKGKERTVLKEALETSRDRDRIRKMLGVYCCSEKRDNILMWAHYAKQHTGFCLEFDIDNDFFRPITCAIKVEYDAIWPELN